MGFIIPVLHEKFKNSKIIALHIDDSIRLIENHANTVSLYSIEPLEVQAFLEKELIEIDASLIYIIEWRPSMNYYREAYVKLLSIVVEFIKRINAEKRTTLFFGRRWIRNFFKNLILINKTILYRKTNLPVIVTGSGPGLEAALPVIRNMQNNCLILASSSSVMALFHAGIKPDIVIATDGGCWALQHIYPFFRSAFNGFGYPANKSAIFAVNLNAVLPSQCTDTPFLILNDGSFWQSIILHELNLPSIIIPQKGTVTASAVELALTLSDESIFLAGMDLSVKDIRTHIKPYGFDHLFINNAQRLKPVYSEFFVRSKLLKDGGSMDIYAAWYKNQLELWPKRIFSIGEGNKLFANSIFSAHEEIVKKTDDYFKTVKLYEDTSGFCKTGVTTLLSALKDSRYKESLKTELVPLLFPNEKKVSDNDLEAAVYEVSK
ncbi:MAG: DUF115 domain-containing protein [Treponema sp.]|jgi:hypothetical protein|nr:DUF115 domain-containing protein [Treponema sp.]